MQNKPFELESCIRARFPSAPLPRLHPLCFLWSVGESIRSLPRQSFFEDGSLIVGGPGGRWVCQPRGRGRRRHPGPS